MQSLHSDCNTEKKCLVSHTRGEKTERGMSTEHLLRRRAVWVSPPEAERRRQTRLRNTHALTSAHNHPFHTEDHRHTHTLKHSLCSTFKHYSLQNLNSKSASTLKCSVRTDHGSASIYNFCHYPTRIQDDTTDNCFQITPQTLSIWTRQNIVLLQQSIKLFYLPRKVKRKITELLPIKVFLLPRISKWD